jgi:antitoxin CptB
MNPPRHSPPGDAARRSAEVRSRVEKPRPLTYIGPSPKRTAVDDPRHKKLKYRAWHRGFVEADLILGPFADQRIEGLSAGHLDDFERLLDQPDPDLYAWIVGTADAPAEFEGGVLEQIRDFRFVAHKAPGQGT